MTEFEQLTVALTLLQMAYKRLQASGNVPIANQTYTAIKAAKFRLHELRNADARP